MTYLPHMTDQELKRMTNGQLVVRAAESLRRLQGMPNARWLQVTYQRTTDELLYRRSVGRLSEALCGVWDHLCRPEGGIHHCDCESA